MKVIKQLTNATVSFLFLCFSFIHGLFLIFYFVFKPKAFQLEATFSSIAVGAAILILLVVFTIPESKWPKKTLAFSAVATAIFIDLSGLWLTLKIVTVFVG